MTIARNHHIFLHQPTYFHLISRCVRRAFLCGKDTYSGKRYAYRKRWLEKRVFELTEIFFVDLYGYAIMSNHYHLVIQTRPDDMLNSDNDEIARRWCRLFPRTNAGEKWRVQTLREDVETIDIYRQRLCDISWLMRCLNEGLARLANKEDGCTGRFWQGRFRSQLLLDDASVYTYMAYVDLNPVRAGISNTPEQSRYTSINYRVRHHRLNDVLCPLNQSESQMNLNLSDYLVLVDEVGRCIRDNKSGYVLDKAEPILTRLGLKANGLEPYHYLKRVFTELPKASCVEDIQALLPYLNPQLD